MLGSARGAPGNRRPYRKRDITTLMSKAAVPEWDVSPRPVGIVELPVGDRHGQVRCGIGVRDRMVRVVGRHPELQVLPVASDREVLEERQVVVPVRLRLDVRKDEVPELPDAGLSEAQGVEQVAAGHALSRVARDAIGCTSMSGLQRSAAAAGLGRLK